MDKIYRMIPVIDDEHPFSVDDYDEISDERDYSEVFSGVPLDAGFYLNYTLKTSGPLDVIDYVSNPLSWPICSLRLADVLMQCGKIDLQLNDVFVLGKDGRSIPFKVLNLLRRFECFDMKRGEIKWGLSPSGRKYVSAVHNWVLESDKIPSNVFLFRVPLMESVVFIREALAQNLLDSGMVGLGFIDDVTLT